MNIDIEVNLKQHHQQQTNEHSYLKQHHQRQTNEHSQFQTTSPTTNK